MTRRSTSAGVEAAGHYSPVNVMSTVHQIADNQPVACEEVDRAAPAGVVCDCCNTYVITYWTTYIYSCITMLLLVAVALHFD
jgi:hypothetical protein